jgi:hypothetical protein
MNFIKLFKPDKVKNIKFNVCDMNRDNYYCLLPDDIVLNILNFIDNRIYLSKVSYQFYIVNRDFTAKCYHLRHYIPHVKKLITNSSLIFINFKNTSVYKFENVHTENNITNFNLLHYIDSLIESHTMITIEHHILSLDYHTVSDMPSELLRPYIEYMPYILNINHETYENITRVVIAFGQEILLYETPNFPLFIYRIIQCFKDYDKILEFINLLCIPYSFDIFLNNYPKPISLYYIILTITSNPFKKVLNLVIELINKYLKLANFTVDKDCLYFNNGKIQNTYILPEHQWFINQL